MFPKLKRLFVYIGSRRFAIVLLVITTSVILIGNLLPNLALMSPEKVLRLMAERPLLYWMTEKFQVRNVTKSSYFLVIPIFILLSVTICTIRRISGFVRERRSREAMPDSKRLAFTYASKGVEGDEVQLILKRKGWRIRTKKDEGKTLYYGIKGAGGIWGSVIFHLGMDIVIVGAIVTMVSLINGRLGITEGFETDPVKMLTEMQKLDVPDDFPYTKMYLESFKTVYEEGFFPVDYTASIKALDRDGGMASVTIGVNRPLTNRGYQFVLSNYYYAPRFIVTDRNGSIIEDAYVNLKVRTVDLTDEFTIPDIGIVIKARFIPDFKEEEGVFATRSMMPNNPVFVLDFFKWDKRIGGGILPLGKRMDFDKGGYTIKFADLREWILIEVSKDSGIPFVTAGIFVVLTGLAIRFMLNEKRLWLIKRENSLEMGGNAFYFPALFDEELRNIGQELGLKPIIK